MVQYLQLEKTDSGNIDANAAIIFDNIVSCGGNKVVYDNLTGTITFDQAGVYYINWFVAQQTGLATDGSNFAIYVEMPSSADQDLIITASSHIKISQTSGFAIVDVEEGKEGTTAKLVNVSNSAAVLSEVTLTKSGITVFEMAASSTPILKPMGYLQAQVATDSEVDDSGLIPFDEIITRDPGGLVTQNAISKFFILKDPGVYLVTWEVPVSATNFNHLVTLSLMVNGVRYSASHSPTPSGVNTGSAIVVTGVENTYIYLQNAVVDLIAVTALANITISQLSKSVVTDEEFFKFTIDTRMTNTRDDDPTHFDGTATTFAIPTSGGINGGTDFEYDWVIDWGDGTPLTTVSGTSSPSGAGINHDYGIAKDYQITIKPNGASYDGWMNAFGFRNSVTGANSISNKIKFKSIDSPLPKQARTKGSTFRFSNLFYGLRNASEIPTDLFSLTNTSGDISTSNMFYQTFYEFAINSTTATIPAGLFDFLDMSNVKDASSMFNQTFSHYAGSSAVAEIPPGLFASFDLANVVNAKTMFSRTFFHFASENEDAAIPTGLFGAYNMSNVDDVSGMFLGTFHNYASTSTTGTIPSDIFDSINVSNATNMAEMFSGTFNNHVHESTLGQIPENLFNSINTVNATNLSGMFNGTFGSYAYQSTVGTIPEGLFDSIATSNATNMEYMFGNTFKYYAYESTQGTIPATLFNAIDSTAAVNTEYMFEHAFDSYATKSTLATIPSGLFNSLDISGVTYPMGMFCATFKYYGRGNPTAVIPSGLFSFIDLENAEEVYDLFNETFAYFATLANTEKTNINDVWGDANFADKLTPETAGGADGAFFRTFLNMFSLTGNAQTFIDTKLNGIIPNERARTFENTTVLDLASLNSNWK